MKVLEPKEFKFLKEKIEAKIAERVAIMSENFFDEIENAMKQIVTEELRNYWVNAKDTENKTEAE